jgi:hypothetical protein
MKAALALAFILPFFAPKATDDSWLPYTSIDSRLRFEMPLEPVEQQYESSLGSLMRSFSCHKADMTYEAVAMDMSFELKEAINEVVSDGQESTGRLLLDGSIEGFLEEMKGKATKTEYGRFNKLVCRTTIADLPGKREASIRSVIGKEHTYVLIVTYPKSSSPESAVKKFYSSIRFEN